MQNRFRSPGCPYIVIQPPFPSTKTGPGPKPSFTPLTPFLQNRIKELEKLLNLARVEQDKSVGQIDILVLERDAARKRQVELEQQLEKQAVLSSAKNDGKNDATIVALKQQLANAIYRSLQLTQANTALKQSGARLQLELQESQNEVRKERVRSQSTQERFLAMQNEIVRLRNEGQKSRQEISQVREELPTLELERSKLVAQQQTVARLASMNQSFQERIRTTEAEKAVALQNVVNLTKTNELLQERLIMADRKSKSAEPLIKQSLEERIRLLQQEQATISSQLAKEQSANLLLASDLQQCKMDLSKQQQQQQQQQKQPSLIETQYSTALRAASDRLQLAQAQVAALEKSNAKLEDRVQRLLTTVTNTENIRVNAQKTGKKLTDALLKVDLLTNQLAMQDIDKKDAEKRSLATIGSLQSKLSRLSDDLVLCEEKYQTDVPGYKRQLATINEQTRKQLTSLQSTLLQERQEVNTAKNDTRVAINALEKCASSRQLIEADLLGVVMASRAVLEQWQDVEGRLSENIIMASLNRLAQESDREKQRVSAFIASYEKVDEKITNLQTILDSPKTGGKYTVYRPRFSRRFR